MSRVFCFGELLLRMSPELDRQWIAKATVPVYVGGAELNVATALAGWNVGSKYCTALPDNYLSKEIIHEINTRNVDSSSIHFSGNRIGIYYLPGGADLKNAGVIYDRAHSSFSELKPGMINWADVLQNCSWFHFSAISPALNRNIVAVCEEALQAATAKNMTISVDLNYREKLWQYGENPTNVMPALLKYCHVVMGNLWAAEKLLAVKSTILASKGKSKAELISAAEESFKLLKSLYPKVRSIAYTFRLDDSYFGVLSQNDSMAVSKPFLLKGTVDKVGSGDCFMGGLIYGLLTNKAPSEIIDFAAAAAVGKLHEKGDATKNSVEQVLAILTNHE